MSVHNNNACFISLQATVKKYQQLLWAMMDKYYWYWCCVFVLISLSCHSIWRQLVVVMVTTKERLRYGKWNHTSARRHFCFMPTRSPVLRILVMIDFWSPLVHNTIISYVIASMSHDVRWSPGEHVSFMVNWDLHIASGNNHIMRPNAWYMLGASHCLWVCKLWMWPVTMLLVARGDQ